MKSDRSISLFWISITINISQPIHYVSAVGEETSYALPWKLYCYSSPSHLTQGKFFSLFAFCLSFAFLFSSFGLLRPLLQICRVWFTQTYQKILTNSPSVRNILTISFGFKVTWFTVVYVLVTVAYVLLTKRTTHVFDRLPTVAFSRKNKFDLQKIYTENIGVSIGVYYCNKLDPFQCLVWRGLTTPLL